MVQHYIEAVTERDRVVGISPNSSLWAQGAAYSIEVHWELRAQRIDDQTTKIVCRVESFTDKQPMAKAMAERSKSIPADQNPMKLHIEEETSLFGKDIERKANAGVWTS